VQGEFGLVEAETARGLAGRVGFEFGQGHIQGGGRFPVAGVGSSAQAWSWARTRPAGAAAAPRSAYVYAAVRLPVWRATRCCHVVGCVTA
jgi:hypothetical protein